MQENRSFDSYFGTFPGADGIPRNACVPNGIGQCVKPLHDPGDRNAGGAHGAQAGILDVDGGRMDGFIRVSRSAQIRRCRPHPSAKSKPNDATLFDLNQEWAPDAATLEAILVRNPEVLYGFPRVT